MSVPILLLLGVTAYKKYRATVFQQRVAYLEKLWLLSIREKT